MRPRVYVETSVVSLATSRPSRDPLTAGLQTQARLWWERCSADYDLVVSEFVIEEAAAGDPTAAERRLALLEGIPILIPDRLVESIAEELLSRSLMPPKARLDALHVASAAVGGADYLLTLNCKHIANATVLPQVYDLLG